MRAGQRGRRAWTERGSDLSLSERSVQRWRPKDQQLAARMGDDPRGSPQARLRILARPPAAAGFHLKAQVLEYPGGCPATSASFLRGSPAHHPALFGKRSDLGQPVDQQRQSESRHSRTFEFGSREAAGLSYKGPLRCDADLDHRSRKPTRYRGRLVEDGQAAASTAY